jgi:segregation and condensation protein A
VSADFTVRLDRVFQGPMDLLLHLVREQEVEIHEVEISRIVEGYLAYLQKLGDLDIELAGDFLVMAATLVAIKSRSLLPQEDVDLEEDLDPRDELIERLIEYRRFKEAAGHLEDMARERIRLHERGFRGELEENREEPTFELGELTVWDLWSAYARLLRETAQNRPHRIVGESRPMRFFVEAAVQAIRVKPRLRLSEIVEQVGGDDVRESVVGSFCALLELVRMGVVGVEQPEERGEIEIALREDAGDLDELLARTGFEDEEPSAAPPAGPTDASVGGEDAPKDRGDRGDRGDAGETP